MLVIQYGKLVLNMHPDINVGNMRKEQSFSSDIENYVG